jgi:large subunit ribosomal protein L24
MLKIKKNDIVQAIKGKDKGKKGRVLTVFVERKRVLVEGVNMVKKHKRKTQQDQQGGIVSIESPISISNIMLVCKQCNRPSRVGLVISKDGAKTRVCKACKEQIS